MNEYNERLRICIDYLKSVRFPCNDWKQDKVYFDQLEQDFSDLPKDDEEKQLLIELKRLIADKRMASLNMNKTAEELYEGWND